MAKEKAHACKCKKSPECEECPEWIFTFADLVMLMMGFFVILWVLKPAPNKDSASPPPTEEWQNTVAAIREGFGYLPDPHRSDPVDKILLAKMHTINPVKGPTPGSKAHVKEDGAKGTDPEVQTIRDGNQALMGGRMLFNIGSAELTSDTKNALDQVADKIRGHYNIVMIKGHTASDDFPDGTPPQQQMDLSLRRAQSAADYLGSIGVDPQDLRVQGCSIFEPVNKHA